MALGQICDDSVMFMPIKRLKGSVGEYALELIINGKPAFRCVFSKKDNVTVLHCFKKTTNHVDAKAMKTAKSRYNENKS